MYRTKTHTRGGGWLAFKTERIVSEILLKLPIDLAIRSWR